MVFFHIKNTNLGEFLEDLATEHYVHLVYFEAIWYILWLFGKFYGHLVYFFLFGMLYQEKYGIPGCDHKNISHEAAAKNDKKCNRHLSIFISLLFSIIF
jgi:hypothetical protein